MGGIVVAVIAIIVTVFVGSKLLGSLSGPSEVSEEEYVAELCDTVDQSIERFDEISDKYSDVDVYGSEFDSSDDAEEARAYLDEQLDAVEAFRASLVSFNDGSVLDTSDGEDLQENFKELLDDWKEELDDASSELADLDADSMTSDDLASINFGGDDSVVVKLSTSDDLRSAADDESSECGDFVGSVFTTG